MYVGIYLFSILRNCKVHKLYTFHRRKFDGTKKIFWRTYFKFYICFLLVLFACCLPAYFCSLISFALIPIFSNFSCRFLNLNIYFFHFELDLRNLQEQVKKHSASKIVSSDLKMFANSRPNFKHILDKRETKYYFCSYLKSTSSPPPWRWLRAAKSVWGNANRPTGASWWPWWSWWSWWSPWWAAWRPFPRPLLNGKVFNRDFPSLKLASIFEADAEEATKAKKNV